MAPLAPRRHNTITSHHHRNLNNMMVVDPRSFRGFCFRGEGRRNLVISAKNDQDECRIVWRLPKDKRARIVSLNSNIENLIQYISHFISPFFHESFVIEPKLVKMHFEHLRHIAKVPLLEYNHKIDSFYELQDELRFPCTLFPLDYRSKTELGVFFEEWSLERLLPTLHKDPFIPVMEMPDATRMPKRIFNHLVMYGPTITVELKPKQGFHQKHPGISVPYCNNCLLQLEKCRSKTFKKMYDYCPLELYSGDFARMMDAISSLFRNPHRNLRVFCDGDCVYEEQSRPENLGLLQTVLFPELPQHAVPMTVLYAVLCYALAGVGASDEPFHVRDDSILATLLKAQKLDTIGVLKAKEIYDRQTDAVKAQLMDENNLLEKRDGKLFTAADDRSLLERYFVAATMKDCSLMVNCRLVRGPTVWNGDSPASRLIKVQTAIGPLYFAVHVQVVDLDPKLPANLLSVHKRLLKGVEMVRQNPHLHPSCRIP